MQLRPHQVQAVEALLACEKGIVAAPCGSGKTIIGAEALRRDIESRKARDRQFLPTVYWLANTREQVHQAEQAVELVFGRTFPDREFSIACPASEPPFPSAAVTHLVVDECHHAAAKTWAARIEACRFASRKWGLSATPEREDEQAPEVFRLLGRVVCTVPDPETGAQVRILDHGDRPELMKAVIADSGFAPQDLWADNTPDWQKRKHWRSVQRVGIAGDAVRTSEIVDGCRLHISQGDSILVIVATVEQGQTLAGRIGLDAQLVHSKLRKSLRAEWIEAFRSGDLPCLIATSLADEGLDVPRANILFLGGAGRSRRAAKQRSGRVLRDWREKERVRIYDFADTWHPWLRGQSKARRKVFGELGYDVQVADRRHRLEEVLACAA